MGGLALATAWVGGVIFAVFWWLASVVVLWEWQRLVGGARLAERVALGGLFIAMAALFALHNSILGAVAGLVLGAGAVGWLAGRGAGTWAGVGALYAGALVASVTLLKNQSELRPCRDFMDLRSCLGSGCRGLFCRTDDWGA